MPEERERCLSMLHTHMCVQKKKVSRLNFLEDECVLLYVKREKLSEQHTGAVFYLPGEDMSMVKRKS